MGSLKLILGPMFSGKSTELLKLAREFESIDKKVLYINHVRNDRYGTTSISTHDQFKTTKKCFSVNSLCYIDLKSVKAADVIVIEELQFFEDAFSHITKFLRGSKSNNTRNKSNTTRATCGKGVNLASKVNDFVENMYK